MTPYLWALMAMLASATMFDSFNLAILSTVAPTVQDLHKLTNTQWGLVNLIIRIGAVISFFVLLLADRFGRRAVITMTILGYALFTGLTGWSHSITTFTLWQFCARIFLAAEFALALIIIGEEYPTHWRSFGIALLGGIGALGTIIAFLTAHVVLTHYDWRTMYLLGLIPVALVFFFRLGMRETRRFAALRDSGGTHTSFSEQLASMRLPFQRRYRKRSLLVTLIWNCNHLVTSPAVTFWTIHAVRDLRYGPQQYTVVVAAGYLIGFLVGAPAAGFCMNRIGRRLTCSLYYFGAAASIFTLFQVDSGDLLLQMALMSVTIVCFLGANAATSTFATELFPTEIRATGYSWTTNLFGRFTEIFTPLAIGWLADRIGIPWAVGVMAIGPVLGGLIVLRYAPETRGKTLEEISDELDGEATGQATVTTERRRARR
ncbi:MAG TPA: MFS transporter [Candidatus Margulisiibacteriota bacterium]|nr:MFS transporter [Candidatus Margulisiibacteriota bacterium]